jgi:hypothetical protein
VKATRLWDLLGLFLIAILVSWLLVSVTYSSLPPIRVFAGASLFPVALIELVAAFLIRTRVSDHELGEGPRQLHPITAARAAALAKASALVGAASAGVWLGFGLWVFPKAATVRAASSDTPGVIVGLVAGVVLVAAALWLEHCCKTPPQPPEEPKPAH